MTLKSSPIILKFQYMAEEAIVLIFITMGHSSIILPALLGRRNLEVEPACLLEYEERDMQPLDTSGTTYLLVQERLEHV